MKFWKYESKARTRQALLSAALLGSMLSGYLLPASAEDAASFKPEGSLPASSTEGKHVFEYDYYAQLTDPLPAHEEERLCGLDKICVTLWRKGKLEIFKEGRLFQGDFNSDGIEDEAMVLEKDQEDDPLGKDYYIYISTKYKPDDKPTVLLHELIPNASNIVDVFWDQKRNALVIDTGGRIERNESISQIGGAAYVYESAAKVYKVVVVVSWNPKTDKFDVIEPGFKWDQKKKKRKKGVLK